MNQLLIDFKEPHIIGFTNYAWAAAIAFVLLQIYIQRKRKRTPPFKGVPLAPNAHWLLGHLRDICRKERMDDKYHKLFVEPANERGLCSFWYGYGPALSITKAVDVQNVLKNSSTHAVSKVVAYHYSRKMGGKEAIVHLAQGKVWKMKRAIVHQCFVKNLEVSTPIFVHVARSLAERIYRDLGDNVSGKVYDVVHLAKLVALDNFGVLATGNDLSCCRSLQMNPFALALKFLEEDATSRLSNLSSPGSVLYWLPTAQNIARKEAERTVVRYLEDFLRVEQQLMNAGNGKAANQRDLANLLLQHVEKDGLSLNTVMEVLRTAFFASYSTTSLGISTALWAIASHPHVEARCVEEIRRVLGPGDIADDKFEVDDLVYLQSAFREALRLFPPVPMASRLLEKEAHLGGETFSAGTKVLIPTWTIHRDPDNFPKPLDFIPERWVKLRDDGAWEERREGDACDATTGVPPANRSAFVAFSGGGRNCVGKNFALTEGTILLALMLRDLKMEVPPGYDLDIRLNTVTLEAENGIPLIFQRRVQRSSNQRF